MADCRSADERKSLRTTTCVLLRSIPVPGQGIYTSKLIGSVADLAGLRMRAYNDSGSEMVWQLGMEPVLIELASLVSALERGDVDAAISLSNSGMEFGLWSHFMHFNDIYAWRQRNDVSMNLDVCESFGRRARSTIEVMSLGAEVFGARSSVQVDIWPMGALKRNGMQIVRPSAKLRKELARISRIMSDSWLRSAGHEGASLIKACNSAR